MSTTIKKPTGLKRRKQNTVVSDVVFSEEKYLNLPIKLYEQVLAETNAAAGYGKFSRAGAGLISATTISTVLVLIGGVPTTLIVASGAIVAGVACVGIEWYQSKQRETNLLLEYNSVIRPRAEQQQEIWDNKAKLLQAEIDNKLSTHKAQIAASQAAEAAYKEKAAIPDKSDGTGKVVYINKDVDTQGTSKSVDMPELIPYNTLAGRLSINSIPFAVKCDGSGSVIRVRLPDFIHILLVGQTGQAKSSVYKTLVAYLAMCGANVKIYACDNSDHTFNSYGVSDRIAVHEPEIAFVIEKFLDEGRRRMGLYAGQSYEGLDEYNKKTGENLPYCILMIDEMLSFVKLVEILLNKDMAGMVAKNLVEIVIKLRKYGMIVIGAGQSAKADALGGTEFRDQFITKVLFNLPGSKVINSMFSATAKDLGLDPSFVGTMKPGECLIKGKFTDFQVVHVKVPYISNKQMMEVAKNYDVMGLFFDYKAVVTGEDNRDNDNDDDGDQFVIPPNALSVDKRERPEIMAADVSRPPNKEDVFQLRKFIYRKIDDPEYHVTQKSLKASIGREFPLLTVGTSKFDELYTFVTDRRIVDELKRNPNRKPTPIARVSFGVIKGKNVGSNQIKRVEQIAKRIGIELQ